MIDVLVGLGIGIIAFAIVVGVGTVVLHRFGGAVAECNSGFTWNNTVDLCTNNTNSSETATPGGAWTSVNYLNTELGTSGLSGWTPAIVAFTVGMVFIGALLIRKGRSRSY